MENLILNDGMELDLNEVNTENFLELAKKLDSSEMGCSWNAPAFLVLLACGLSVLDAKKIYRQDSNFHPEIELVFNAHTGGRYGENTFCRTIVDNRDNSTIEF